MEVPQIYLLFCLFLVVEIFLGQKVKSILGMVYFTVFNFFLTGKYIYVLEVSTRVV